HDAKGSGEDHAPWKAGDFPYLGAQARLTVEWSRALVEKGLEAGGADPADRQPRTVFEGGQARVFAVGLAGGDARESYAVRTVNAHERFGIETGFEAGDGLLLEDFFARASECHVVVLGFREIEFADGNQCDFASVLDDDALEVLLRRARSSSKLLAAGHFFSEAALGAL